eukprot:TRINITY_DN1973_c0_g1_i5.p1 TRINITY_DN1973_c0_g1~~TRINITY_DN1973_c0_g1_i5.p1  ORF type:complete len:521 (-),score=106.67 TRINITY_DN1973_c0_g1_i5:56-1618(-)
MFLAMHGSFLALCLVLFQASGDKNKEKWMIIETAKNEGNTQAKESGQDFSLGADGKNLGPATLKCESDVPFKKCRFQKPDGKFIQVGNRCTGSMYGTTGKRIEKICRVDESFMDKTDTVCGIVINHVKQEDIGTWSCEYQIKGQWIKEETQINIVNNEIEMEGPLSEELMIQKGEIVLKPNNVITILPDVGSEFKIDFDLYISEYERKEWTTILLFAVDKGLIDFLKYGDRIPGVYIHDTKIYICSAINGKANVCSGTDVKLKTWTYVEICQHVLGGKLTFEVLIDEKSVYKKVNNKPCRFKNVKVFAGDPLHMTHHGKIKNLHFTTADKTNGGACVVDYTPTPVPSSGYISKDPLVLKKDHLITVLPFLGSQYKITFDLYLSSYGDKPVYSVLHFTQNGDATTYGDRNPAIWISREKKVLVCSAINGMLNFPVYSQPTFPLKTWMPVVISQTLVDKKIIYEVKINGVTLISMENNQPQLFQAVKVYAGDPWYLAQDGKIKNLKVLTQDDRECIDQCLAV